MKLIFKLLKPQYILLTSVNFVGPGAGSVSVVVLLQITYQGI